MTDIQTAKALAELLPQLNAEEYPEIWDVLNAYREQDGSFYVDDPLELAADLFPCDETKPLPPPVAALMERIYGDAIAEKDYGAANDLGALYYTGRIGEQNYEKAMHYYAIAAGGGDRQAQENLAYCYYYGRAGKKDYEKAFHYFALGAFDGHLRSLYKIGDMYRNGYYVEQNEEEAFRIYARCEETLTEEAVPLVGADIMLRRGDCFFEGIGCERDMERALFYYQHAQRLFFERLQTGDFLIRRCYEKAVTRQEEARRALEQTLPNYDWTR